MSLQPAVGAQAFTPVASVEPLPVVPAAGAAGIATSPEDEALEFVRFCYRRRRVGWPALYDEMSAVAARGTYKGMGYGDLAERGISFCLGDLPRLVALTERVVREEQPISEPVATTISLRPATA